MNLGDNIGRIIQEMRKKAGISQPDMAYLMGLTTNTISNKERNETEVTLKEYLAYKQIVRMRALGADLEEIKIKVEKALI